MEQPVTPPTNSSEPPAETPEHGLVAPLSVHEIASWTSHAWYDEPMYRIQQGHEEADVLQELLMASGDQNTVRRICAMIDWMLDCIEEILDTRYPTSVTEV